MAGCGATAMLLAAAVLAACSSQPDPVPAGLVISNVTVISLEREAPLANACVRIIDGRIAEVSAEPLAGERTIDGDGGYLVPGLIEGRVHLDMLPVLRPEDEVKHPGPGAARAGAPQLSLFRLHGGRGPFARSRLHQELERAQGPA